MILFISGCLVVAAITLVIAIKEDKAIIVSSLARLNGQHRWINSFHRIHRPSRRFIRLNRMIYKSRSRQVVYVDPNAFHDL